MSSRYLFIATMLSESLSSITPTLSKILTSWLMESRQEILPQVALTNMEPEIKQKLFLEDASLKLILRPNFFRLTRSFWEAFAFLKPINQPFVSTKSKEVKQSQQNENWKSSQVAKFQLLLQKLPKISAFLMIIRMGLQSIYLASKRNLEWY